MVKLKEISDEKKTIERNSMPTVNSGKAVLSVGSKNTERSTDNNTTKERMNPVAMMSNQTDIQR